MMIAGADEASGGRTNPLMPALPGAQAPRHPSQHRLA